MTEVSCQSMVKPSGLLYVTLTLTCSVNQPEIKKYSRPFTYTEHVQIFHVITLWVTEFSNNLQGTYIVLGIKHNVDVIWSIQEDLNMLYANSTAPHIGVLTPSD